MIARMHVGAPVAIAAIAWCLVLHAIFEHTWTFGRRTFVCLVLLALIVGGAAAFTRLGGRLGGGKLLGRLLAWGALAATVGFTVVHVTTLQDHLFGEKSAIGIVDVGQNTWCAADRLFAHGENPYAHRCQIKSVWGVPHVRMEGHDVTMFGVPYDYGYPYFPAMFLSYEPLRQLAPSARCILYGNFVFYFATLAAIAWLTMRLASPDRDLGSAALAMAAYSGVLGVGRETFYAGHTDGVIALYALLGFLAMTYGRHATAGALFGLALAAKLLPGAIFAAVLIPSYRRSRARWRFTGALVATVVLVVGPFVVWNAAAFLSATILFYLTLHAPGDDTSLWFFLPEWARLPFTLVGLAAMAWLFVRQARRAEPSVAALLRTCVLIDLVFLAFSRMMHLNYLLAILPLGAVAIAASAAEPALEPT